VAAFTREKGSLDKWIDDKGFGFITPDKGGKNIFVHISSFDRNIPRRPKTGDTIYYYIKTGNDGKSKAFDAAIEGAAAPVHKKKTTNYKKQYRERSSKNSLGSIVLCFAVVIGIGSFLFNQAKRSPVTTTNVQVSALADNSYTIEEEAYYTCEGKTYCSEMSSCEEATFYIRNCPGTKMDGDNDGIPCERQFCN
jgi:cold shock CspA family protein